MPFTNTLREFVSALDELAPISRAPSCRVPVGIRLPRVRCGWNRKLANKLSKPLGELDSAFVRRAKLCLNRDALAESSVTEHPEDALIEMIDQGGLTETIDANSSDPEPSSQENFFLDEFTGRYIGMRAFEIGPDGQVSYCTRWIALPGSSSDKQVVRENDLDEVKEARRLKDERRNELNKLRLRITAQLTARFKSRQGRKPQDFTRESIRTAA